MREAGLYIQLSHPHVNQLPAHLPETKDRCIAKTETCSSPNGAQSKYNCSRLAMKDGARSPPTAEENRTRPGPCEGFNHQMEGPGGVWAQTPQVSKSKIISSPSEAPGQSFPPAPVLPPQPRCRYPAGVCANYSVSRSAGRVHN